MSWPTPARATRREAFEAAVAAPDAPRKDEPDVVVQNDALEQIRIEMKQRLAFFQVCAVAARRRGVPDVRRVQATWSVAADGTITTMKLDGVTDPKLATCITRIASRPFRSHPGIDITIPTPIVFVH
jgi:hypothetical protein